MRKGLAALLIFFFLFPSTSLAVGEFTLVSLDDPTGIVTQQPFYNAAADSIHVMISGTKAVTAKYTSYTDTSFSTVAVTKTLPASNYGWQFLTGMGFNCNVPYEGELLDAQGNTLLKIRLVITGLVNPVCDSESGGDNMGGGDGDCDSCAIFECPGWDDYMDKLDEIKNAIPPAPDWNKVSKIFSDAIVPRLVSETRDMLDDLLGKAPTPPPTLPDLPQLDDRQFEQQKPEIQDVPGLDGFDENDVKNGAPVIPFEDDPTGGFDLSIDPLSNLPDVVPGGDPGAYKRDPKDPQNDYPGAPADKSIDMGGAPKPGDSTATPPVPGDSGGAPPTPGGNIGAPPTPGGNIGSPGIHKPQP